MTTNSADLKLELVQVLFRHGARTYHNLEVNFFPAYLIDKSLLETYGLEQLTNLGKRQAYDLGVTLRKRYGDFLGADYRPGELYARSTDHDRTKASLMLLLAGLYPPSTLQTWNSNLNWIPIPFNFLPKQVDVLLKPMDMPTFSKHLLEAKNSKYARENTLKLLQFDKLYKEYGISRIRDSGFDGAIGLYNILYIGKTEKTTLPDWYTDDLLMTMKENTLIYFNIMTLTKEMRKIIGGPLVTRFIDNMNLRAANVDDKIKLYLYSAHEFNIVGLMKALDLKGYDYPDFSSAIIIEKLRDSNNQVYVKILAWTGSEYLTLKIGDYEEFCPVDEFLRISKDVVLTDEEFASYFGDVNFNVQGMSMT